MNPRYMEDIRVKKDGTVIDTNGKRLGTATETADGWLVQMDDGYNALVPDVVHCESLDVMVAAWLDKYYKPERLNRNKDTRAWIIADRTKDLIKWGNTLISKHDSVTGKAEWLRR